MPMQRLDARHADAAAASLGEAFFDDPRDRTGTGRRISRPRGSVRGLRARN